MQHVAMIGMDSTQTGLLCRLALTRLIIAMGYQDFAADNYNTTYTPFFSYHHQCDKQNKRWRKKHANNTHTHHLYYTDKVIYLLLLNGFSALE